MGRGLLNRLATGDRRPDTVSSVLHHLKAILNSAHGCSQSSPDFGLIDFNDVVHSMPEAIGTIQQSIRAAILRYEPRLRNVSVRFVPTPDEPLSLRFEIVARLADKRRSVVRVATSLKPGGNYIVE